MTAQARSECRHPRLPIVALAALLGAAFAAWLYGWRVLDPASHAWLLHGDPAQHYIGAVHFMGEPWRWPPGAMRGFGDAGTSVMLTDSLPLLAIAAKVLGWPAYWQYFGLWLYASHALAGAAGAALLWRLGCAALPALLGAAFFATAPVLLLRTYGHEALQGQFLLLAALALAFGPWRAWPWVALIVLAVWVHPYLAAMVFAMAAAGAAAACGERRVAARRLPGMAVLTLASAAGAAYLAGYFGRGGQYSAAGYDFFSANLLTWFDPMAWASFLAQHGRDVAQGHEWSRLLPGLGQATAGQYEGFAYLGAGMLALLVLASGSAILRRPVGADWPSRRRWLWLSGACGALALLAVSVRPTLGTHVLFELPLPAAAAQLLGLFRASGRFIWPLTYLLMAWSIARVARLSGAPLWLAAALLIQTYDLSAKLTELRERFRTGPPGVAAAPASPLWAQALRTCPRMELLFWPADDGRWITPALAAARAGAAITPAPVARPQPQVEQAQRQVQQARLAGQGWRQDTLYVLPQASGEPPVQPPGGFRPFRADGFVLFAAPRCLPSAPVAAGSRDSESRSQAALLRPIIAPSKGASWA